MISNHFGGKTYKNVCLEENIKYPKVSLPKFKKRETLYNKIVPSTLKNNTIYNFSEL